MTSTTRRGLAAPVATLMAGGGGSSTHLLAPATTEPSFPLPLTPLPLKYLRKEIHTLYCPWHALPLFRLILGLENAPT